MREVRDLSQVGLNYGGGTSKSLDTGATGLHKPEIQYGYIPPIREYTDLKGRR
jgi:hypothetical protein